MILKVIKNFLLLIFFLFPLISPAEVLQFETEELPAESVVPQLDSSMAVKSKIVPLAGRLEMGFILGSIIDEMFFANTLLGLQVFYYVTEDSAWGVTYLDHMKGLSTYSEQFGQTSAKVDFNKAPAPTTVLTGSYRWSFLYGKMSFSKNLVLPTVISMEADAGVSKVGSQSLPFTSAGITHKLLPKKNLGIALSYRILLYQTLDPASVDLGEAATVPAESDFAKKIQVGQSLDLTLSYLF